MAPMLIYMPHLSSRAGSLVNLCLALSSGLCLRMQGAAEIVLRRCVSVMDDTGAEVPLADEMRAKLEETVTNMASTGLRTLCLTLRDMDEGMAEGNEAFWENPPDEQLTLCCIVGIKVRRRTHPIRSIYLPPALNAWKETSESCECRICCG